MSPAGLVIFSIVTILLGIYMIIQGVRKSYMSGFKFYITAGLIESIPFLLLPVFLLVESKYLLGAVLVWFVFSKLASVWEDQLKQKARETHPLKWQEWENTINHTSVIDRLLFYRGTKRNQTDQDVKVVSHELTK